MTSADGGHWAFASFWVAWQMQVTNGETNRLFEDNESQYKKETLAANVQQWLADKEILEVHLHALKQMIVLRCLVHKQLLSLKYLPHLPVPWKCWRTLRNKGFKKGQVVKKLIRKRKISDKRP